MLVLQPNTSTMIMGDTGGKVAVSVAVGASVKAVDVSVGVIGVAVSVGVSETTAGMLVCVAVTITGVGVKIEGVIVGGGAGKVGTVYDQPSQALSSNSRKIAIRNIFFIPCSFRNVIVILLLQESGISACIF